MSQQQPGTQGNLGGLSGFLGPFLLGALLNAGIYGGLMVQCYTYFLTSAKDPRWRRIMVFCILVLQSYHTVMTCYVPYVSLVRGSGRMKTIRHPQKSFYAAGVVAGFIICTVQTFFNWRIWVLVRSRTLTLLIQALVLAAVASTFVAVLADRDVFRIPGWRGAINFQIVCVSLHVLADLMASISLVRYLRKNRTPFHSTQSLFDRITFLTIQTGVVFTCCAIGAFILFFVKDSNCRFILIFSLPPIYCSSLVGSLNLRLEGNVAGAQTLSEPSGWRSASASASASAHTTRSALLEPTQRRGRHRSQLGSSRGTEDVI